MTKVHVGVGVEQVDQSLASVTTGTDEGNLSRGSVGSVLLAQRGVGVGSGVGAHGVDGNGGTHTRGTEGVGGRGESTLLLNGSTAGTVALGEASGCLVSAVEARLEVDVTEHLAAVLGKLLHQLLDLLAVLNTVPEEDLTVAAQAAIGLVKEPGQVLVVLLDGPGQLGEVLLQALEDVVGDIGEPAGLGDGESSQLGDQGALLRGQHNGEGLHGVVIVELEVVLLETLNVAVHHSAGIQTLTITHKNILQLLKIFDLREGGLDVHLVTTADQSTGTGIGEQLLLQIRGVDDSNAGRTRQVAEQVLHLLNLETSTVAHPPLGHEVVVLLIQVNSGNLLTSVTVEETTLLSQVDNLQWLESAGQLTGSDVSIDVQDLTIGSLGHGSKDRQTTSGDSRLDGLLVDAIDLTDEVVLGLIKVVGGEHTGGQRTGTDTHALQLLYQLHVLLEEQLAGKRKGLTVSHPDTILKLGLNAGILQHLVELRTGTVNDDGVQTNMVQEGERGGKGLQVLGDNRTTDLDDGELLRGNRGEVGEVLLDFTLGADVAQ